MRKFPKDLTSIRFLDAGQIKKIISLAHDIKNQPEKCSGSLKGMDGACIFQRPSSRTRYGFHRAVTEMNGTYMEIPWDTSFVQLLPVKGADMEIEMKSFAAQGMKFLLIRQNSQEFVEALARYAPFTVINGCTDKEHPLQALADFLTLSKGFENISENPKNMNFVFLGSGKSPVFTSLAMIFSSMSLRMNFVGPEKRSPPQKFCKKYNIEIHDNLSDASPDIIYLDQWNYTGNQKIPLKYRVTEKNLGRKLDEIKIMHCLPSGTEISASMLNSKNSLCYQQSANRVHVQKAVLLLCMGLV